MDLKSDLIHPDDISTFLESCYSGFVDEMHRIVDIRNFQTLFTYKYANQIGNYQFWIEYKKRYDEIHCQNVSGMTFIFPLVK